jgi:hypothetical protein
LFPKALRGLYPAPSPASCKTGSSFHTLNVYFRVQVASSLPTCADASRHLPRGFLPHRDTSLVSPLTARFPHRAYRSALSVSHALGGLLLTVPCGPISSHCHVQGLPFRGFPRYPADPTHRRAQFLPSCHWRCSPTSGKHWRQLPSPRLQGFVPSSDPYRTSRV